MENKANDLADTISQTFSFDEIASGIADLLSVVNELKNAGAEAISINGQRIISSTSITCAGNVANINGEKVGVNSKKIISYLPELNLTNIWLWKVESSVYSKTFSTPKARL